MKKLFLLLLLLVAPPAMADPAYLVYGQNENWDTDLLIRNGTNISRLDLTRCISGPPRQINLGVGQVRFVSNFAYDVPCAQPIGAVAMNLVILSGIPDIRIATYARSRSTIGAQTAFLIPALYPMQLGEVYSAGPVISDTIRDTSVFLTHVTGDATGVVEVVLEDATGDKIAVYVLTVPPFGVVNFQIPRTDVPVGLLRVAHRASTGGAAAEIVGFVATGRRAPDSGSQIIFPMGAEVASVVQPCQVSPCF